MITAAVTRKLAESADLSPTMRVLVAKLLQITLFTLAVVIGLRAIGLDVPQAVELAQKLQVYIVQSHGIFIH